MTPWALWQHVTSPFLPPTEPPAVGARETCSCGAHTRIDGTDWVTARNHLDAWRQGHRHEMRPDVGDRDVQLDAYVERAEIGFVGGDCA